MNIPTIKDLMREQAVFTRYQDGKLWYEIIWTGGIFQFPIDVTGDDAGGEFGSNEKAITLMRWIRKHIELLNTSNDS